MPQSGYTLPVFACASAVAALRHLQNMDVKNAVSLNLVNPPEIATIPLEQVAKLNDYTALAITRSEPGENLDLTRNTPVWAIVELNHNLDKITAETPQIQIQGGEGIGKQINNQSKAAIYRYAHILLQENLKPLLTPDDYITVILILPAGRQLAKRTSNAAFGVVEGLSLLGISGISQPLSSREQLEIYQTELINKTQQFQRLVFCVGENGLNLAQQMGINPAQLVKTANWLGPMLVTAGINGVKELLLFGYHGKLIKLAGGIFHTHHYLADGRLEILTANLADLGVSSSILSQVFNSETTETALRYLQDIDQQTGSDWVTLVYNEIAAKIDHRSQDYIYRNCQQEVKVGSILFDRQRCLLVKSENGESLLHNLLNS